MILSVSIAPGTISAPIEFYLQFFRDQAEVLKPLPEDQREYVAREKLPKIVEVEPVGPFSDSEDGEPQPSTSYQL